MPKNDYRMVNENIKIFFHMVVHLVQSLLSKIACGDTVYMANYMSNIVVDRYHNFVIVPN